MGGRFPPIRAQSQVSRNREASSMTQFRDFDEPRRKLLSLLYEQGITDLDVLAAMQGIPRERFVDPTLHDEAYENHPLPIGFGQTISQPYIIAKMTETLSVSKDCRVLEIGTGSGYQTAILARLARQVFTIERIAELSERARRTLADLGYTNVDFRVADGTLGWPEQAPFDRILVTAAGPQVPPSLREQLAESGRLVIPVQPSPSKHQGLFVFTKKEGELEPLYLGGCRFVPLIGKQGYADETSAT